MEHNLQQPECTSVGANKEGMVSSRNDRANNHILIKEPASLDPASWNTRVNGLVAESPVERPRYLKGTLILMISTDKT